MQQWSQPVKKNTINRIWLKRSLTRTPLTTLALFARKKRWMEERVGWRVVERSNLKGRLNLDLNMLQTIWWTQISIHAVTNLQRITLQSCSVETWLYNIGEWRFLCYIFSACLTKAICGAFKLICSLMCGIVASIWNTCQNLSTVLIKKHIFRHAQFRLSLSVPVFEIGWAPRKFSAEAAGGRSSRQAKNLFSLHKRAGARSHALSLLLSILAARSNDDLGFGKNARKMYFYANPNRLIVKLISESWPYPST